MSRAAFPLIKFVPSLHALLPCTGLIIWKPRSTYRLPGVACKMDMILTQVFFWLHGLAAYADGLAAYADGLAAYADG